VSGEKIDDHVRSPSVNDLLRSVGLPHELQDYEDKETPGMSGRERVASIATAQLGIVQNSASLGSIVTLS
jgi:hypothetical protein